MIVVVGNPSWRPGPPAAPHGRAARLAVAAAALGARVELVGRAGDDRAGDALLVALAQAGVGHAALLRDPARPTPLAALADPDDDGVLEPAATAPATAPGPVLEPADVALGLRYLREFAVLVVADGVPADCVPVAAEAAAFAGAHLVVLAADDRAAAAAPADATVLAAPPDDGGDAFTGFVARYAAAVDGGADPAAAFARATGEGWEPAPGA